MTVALFVDVASIDDLPQGTQKTVFVNTTRILLCNTIEGLFALEDKCPHAFQPLAGGDVGNGEITCPKHGACFELTTGKSLNGVTARPVKTFNVRIHEGRVEVCL